MVWGDRGDLNLENVRVKFYLENKEEDNHFVIKYYRQEIFYDKVVVPMVISIKYF